MYANLALNIYNYFLEAPGKVTKKRNPWVSLSINSIKQGHVWLQFLKTNFFLLKIKENKKNKKNTLSSFFFFFFVMKNTKSKNSKFK